MREPLFDRRAAEEALEARGNDSRDLRGGQLARRWQQPVALLVELADDARPHLRIPVVELRFHLGLDDGALLLHHQHFLETPREGTHAVLLQGPRHADLVEPQADVGGHALVDAEVVQRLAHVEVALAGGDDPEPRPWAVDHDAVEPVGRGEGQRGVDLVALQAQLPGRWASPASAGRDRRPACSKS